MRWRWRSKFHRAWRRGAVSSAAAHSFRVAVVCLLLLLTGRSFSQTDLEKIRADIDQMRKRLDALHSQQKSAERDLEEATIELDIRTRELQVAVTMQTQLETQEHELQNQVSALAPRIQRQKQFLARRLNALYRLGGLSYIRLLLSIDDRRDPVQAVSMLSYLVSRDARAVSRFEGERRELTARMADLAAREKQLAEMRKVVEQRQRDVSNARAGKERLLASLQREGTQSEQKLAQLEEKARRLERLVDVLAKQSGVAQAAADIRGVQGALAWPVQGKIVERFGKQRNAKFSTVTMNNGLKIAATPGSAVRAVFPGTVLFSQWFKGYGNLIILDHGNRVFSLYGNLKSPSVAPGDHIGAGQTIAGVGEAEDGQSGFLYFEIRNDNKPEDPQKWLR